MSRNEGNNVSLDYATTAEGPPIRGNENDMREFGRAVETLINAGSSPLSIFAVANEGTQQHIENTASLFVTSHQELHIRSLIAQQLWGGDPRGTFVNEQRVQRTIRVNWDTPSRGTDANLQVVEEGQIIGSTSNRTLERARKEPRLKTTLQTKTCETCSICLDDIKLTLEIVRCKRCSCVMHLRECAEGLSNRECPVCRLTLEQM